LSENIIEKKTSSLEVESSTTEIPVKLNPEDSSRLLKELQLREIELELKNEKLKESNNELEKRLDVYSSLFYHSPTPSLIVDQDGTIFNVNKAALDIMKIAPELLINTPLHQHISDNCGDTITKLLCDFSASSKPQSVAIKLKTGCRDDLTAFLEVYSFADNNYYINIHADTSYSYGDIFLTGNPYDQPQWKKALAESENNYRMLFESMPVGLAISDLLGNIIYGNKKSRILLGITRSELKMGKIALSRWKFIHKDGSEIVNSDLPNMKVPRYNKMIDYAEIGIIKDDKLTWLNVTAAPLPNNEILIAFIDISQQIERENELKLLSEKLQELNATKDKFFSIIAHDLKNPFNSILGFSELMLNNLSKYNTEEIERFVTIINNTSQNAFNLLENLLNWSRSQTGTIEFNPNYYNLSDIIHFNIDFVENLALKKNVRIYFYATEKLMVEIDKNMIDTVLRNILTNSIKFSYPGGKIIISAERTEKFYKVCVKDNGIGIEEENIDKLFRIDSKYSSYGTNQEKGSGLGLIICKEFIEKNKGQIWATSEFGKGSEFCFTLPRA
jgi:PAS domain S-box-containing protein